MSTFIAEYRDEIVRNTIYKVFFITANTMRGAKAKATRVCPVAYHGSYIDLYALVNGAYVKVSTQGTYGWADVEAREEPTNLEGNLAMNYLEWKAKYGIKAPFPELADHFTPCAGHATVSNGNMQYYSPAYPVFCFTTPDGMPVVADNRGFSLCDDRGLAVAHWEWRDMADRNEMLFNYGCYWAKGN